MGGELVADVPFKLMHPAPGMIFRSIHSDGFKLELLVFNKGSAMYQGKGKLTKSDSQQGRYESNYAREDEDENIVFEDFARLRST